VAGIFHDLEILSGAGLFNAEEHGGLASKDTTSLATTLRPARAKTLKNR